MPAQYRERLDHGELPVSDHWPSLGNLANTWAILNMNAIQSCLAEHGIAASTVMQLGFALFIGILFLQSGLDKVFNWSGEKAFYTKHFSKSILKGQVPILMPVITLVECGAGIFSAMGFIQLLLNKSTMLGTVGMLLAATALIMLFFGQRVAKDYSGAAVLVPYFLLAMAGLWFFLAH